jgi:predicted aspartyl protease
MPIIHCQVKAIASTPDGKQIQVPPAQALAVRGPVVQVLVSVPAQVAERLTKESKPIPSPVPGLGLIDTGATGSCVDEEVAKKLQLPIVNVVSMASAAHAATDRNVYPLTFDILGFGATGKITVNSPRVTGAELGVQGLILLIGRDLLANTCLIYNGIAGAFTLSI